MGRENSREDNGERKPTDSAKPKSLINRLRVELTTEE